MAIWYNSINQNVGSQKIRDINEYINFIDDKELCKSSIDRFYKAIGDLLSISKDPTFLESNPAIGPLLFVGIISSTENYFREIMSESIQICPICQSSCASQSISLGSVLWHAGCNIEKGSFENISFADADAIRKTCRKYLDFDIDKKSLAYAALDEFDKICELRHGVVHSSNILAGKNAVKLGLDSNKKIIKIKINYKQLQECAAICNALVSSFNSELFKLIVKRWAVDWPKLPTRNSLDDNKSFKRIWTMFYSEIDNKKNLISPQLSMVRCRNLVKKEYKK